MQITVDGFLNSVYKKQIEWICFAKIFTIRKQVVCYRTFLQFTFFSIF